jgi:hypothetical protein
MVYVLPRLCQADPDSDPYLLVRDDVARCAERFHVLPLVAERMPLRQSVMRLDRRSAGAPLAGRMRVEEQSVPFLTTVRFAGSRFGAPRTGIAHLFSSYC